MSAGPSDTEMPSGETDDEPDHGPAGAPRALIALGSLVVLGAIVWGASAVIDNGPAEDSEPLARNTGGPLPWRMEGSPAPDENPAAIERPVVLFDDPVTIESGLGVDLDRIDADKPGAQDVFWSQRSGLSVKTGSLYLDQGLPADAAQRCATAVAEVADDTEGYPSLDVFPGDQFCLSTSEGRIAWLRIGEGSAKADELAVQVTVWDGIPS
ncbi:hypothetical protein [Kineosporia babensis]|uniref:Uncharacterized protein n=1 Tax=Kineosporia babensis TaxID=499548 RepID=A0A9X1NCR9_9ACTN|nr:hypothetical protein [Kineosporia babensis]MCD5311374.1 hypothetical protein [Kineosporia babensis]